MGMSEKLIIDALELISSLNIKQERHAAHWTSLQYLKQYKDLEALGIRPGELILSLPATFSNNDDMTQEYAISVLHPTQNFEQFLKSIYSELSNAYFHKNYIYINEIESLIYLIDRGISKTILYYIQLLLSHGVPLDHWKKFIDDEWSNYLNTCFRYSDYFPFLSRIKVEYEKAINFPQNSYIRYFSALPANNDWGVLSEIIVKGDTELVILGDIDGASINACISSVIDAISRLHNIEMPEDYIARISLNSLAGAVFTLHQQVFRFSVKDFDFVLFILKELRRIYNMLNIASENRFKEEYKQIKEVLETLIPLSGAFIRT